MTDALTTVLHQDVLRFGVLSNIPGDNERCCLPLITVQFIDHEDRPA